MTRQEEQPTEVAPKKKSHLKKIVSAAGALVVLAVGAFFTGFGEGAVNRLIDGVTSSTQDSLTVAVRTDVGSADDRFALERKETEGQLANTLLSGKIGAPWDVFLGKNNGAPVEDMVVSMVLTGRPDATIRITNIDVEKLSSGSVLAGTAIRLHSAAEVETIKVAVDLDDQRPRILADNGAPYFPDRNIELKAGEQESLKFTVTGSKGYYRWVFAIDYVDESGAPQRVFVNRVGKMFKQPKDSPLTDAFALTGAAPAYQAEWKERDNGGGALYLVSG